MTMDHSNNNWRNGLAPIQYRKEIEDKLSKRRLPTNFQKGEKILRTIILKAASRHIPSGRHRINTEPVPAEILERMRARDDLRSRYPTSLALQHMNAEITRTTNEHRRNTWRQFVETLDHRTDPSNLWRTIKAIDGKPRQRLRGVKSKARIIHTGVPQGSKLSPTLFSFYIADMPRPTEPVKQICYADDITVWALE